MFTPAFHNALWVFFSLFLNRTPGLWLKSFSIPCYFFQRESFAFSVEIPGIILNLVRFELDLLRPALGFDLSLRGALSPPSSPPWKPLWLGGPTLQQLASFQHLLASVSSRLPFPPSHGSALDVLYLNFLFSACQRFQRSISFYWDSLYAQHSRGKGQRHCMALHLTLSGGLAFSSSPACLCFPALYDLGSSVLFVMPCNNSDPGCVIDQIWRWCIIIKTKKRDLFLFLFSF